MARISKHFTREEFECPTTGQMQCQDGFIEHLEALRVEYGKPMVVTSGCRTNEHNEMLIEAGFPASHDSLHLINNDRYNTDTCAVDIAKPNFYDQAELIKIALEHGWTVRVGKTFIHLDMRVDYTSLRQHFTLY